MDASAIPTRFVMVTPDDVVGQAGVGLVYSGGVCKVITAGGDTVSLPAAFAGIVLPLQVKQVLATGTTATAIGLFR